MFGFHDVLMAFSLAVGSLILLGLILRPTVNSNLQELIDEDRRNGGYSPCGKSGVSVKPPPRAPNGDDFKIFEDHPALLDILRFSKQSGWTHLDGKQELKNQLSKALGPHYTIHANELDIHKVLYLHWWMVINEPKFQTGRTVEEKVEKLLNAAFEAKWGVRGAVYPNEVPNDVEDVLYLQIEHMLSTFQLTNIGWCREILYPEEKQMQAKSSG